MRACVRACVRVCVRVCVCSGACVRVCICAYVLACMRMLVEGGGGGGVAWLYITAVEKQPIGNFR